MIRVFRNGNIQVTINSGRYIFTPAGKCIFGDGTDETFARYKAKSQGYLR